MNSGLQDQEGSQRELLKGFEAVQVRDDSRILDYRGSNGDEENQKDSGLPNDIKKRPSIINTALLHPHTHICMHAPKSH